MGLMEKILDENGVLNFKHNEVRDFYSVAIGLNDIKMLKTLHDKTGIPFSKENLNEIKENFREINYSNKLGEIEKYNFYWNVIIPSLNDLN